VIASIAEAERLAPDLRCQAAASEPGAAC